MHHWAAVEIFSPKVLPRLQSYRAPLLVYPFNLPGFALRVDQFLLRCGSLCIDHSLIQWCLRLGLKVAKQAEKAVERNHPLDRACRYLQLDGPQILRTTDHIEECGFI